PHRRSHGAPASPLRFSAPRGRHVFGPRAEIKQAIDFRRFTFRGVTKVRGEWDLVCAVFNVRRLNVLGVEMPQPWPRAPPRGRIRRGVHRGSGGAVAAPMRRRARWSFQAHCFGGAKSKRRRRPRSRGQPSRRKAGATLGAASPPCYAIAMELRGAVALVTGASRGVGRAIAVALADAGADVACAARATDSSPLKLPGTIDATVR